MRCYVTGGCGFIGSHLVDLLLACNHETTLVDNLSRGKNMPITTGGWNVCLADLTEKCPDFESHSVVFHLAAKVTSISYNMSHNYSMLHTNTAINMTVAEAIRRSKPKLVVWVSTACVYPHDAPTPTPEEWGEIGQPEPTNAGYGMGKRHGEQLAKWLCLEHGIPTIIVRFFNAFGRRDYYDEETSHVAPALIKRVLDGENPVVVWGTGDQTRALVDASDIAYALLKLARRGLDGGEGFPWVVNIGHEREISMRDLVNLIVDKSGIEPRPEIVFDTSRPDGYARRSADTTRLRELIGWVPDMPIEKTIEDMIADYRHRRFQTG